MSSLRVHADLIRRYDVAGPRYTSYPTAVQFHPSFTDKEYREVAMRVRGPLSPGPLSLYVHVPFCASPCFYCGCNRVITRSYDRAQAYLHRLYREIGLQAALFDRARTVEQLHFGGGTPTFLHPNELTALMGQLRTHFTLSDSPAREYSIEIDPRTVTPDYVHALAAMGFNRMSLGIQDFDRAVQVAINRIQPVEDTLRVIESAREAGIGSLSFDLIYGLPRQTLEGFSRTLDVVIASRPDRLAVYGYAHMPQVFKAQRRLERSELPSPALRLELLRMSIERLTGAGYEYIGLDHFALPTDELVKAKRAGALHRNFQGYSTRANLDLVAVGVSAIGHVGDAYSQNEKQLPEYYRALDAGRLPIQRGVRLTPDDTLRAAVIQSLMCHEQVDFDIVERTFGIDFAEYFGAELARLETLELDGLVERRPRGLLVTPAGRLLVRHVAMVFDAYLAAQQAQQRYSKVI